MAATPPNTSSSSAPERDFLALLIAELEKKVGWGDCTQWSSSQLRILEEQIEELTRIRISEYTLRRIIHRQVANPQMATRNALAQFVGYAHWFAFTQWANEAYPEHSATAHAAEASSPDANRETLLPTPDELTKQHSSHKASAGFGKNRLRRRNLLLFLLLALLLALPLFRRLAPGRFLLEASQNTTLAPFEVKFSWQYPLWVSDSVFLEIDSYNERSRFALPSTKGTLQHTFLIPASSEVRLVYRNKVRKRMRIKVASKDWVIVTKTAGNHWFFLEKDLLFLEEGALRFPPQLAREYNLSPLSPSIHYRYIGANLADGNRFRFEAVVRNARSDGAVPCYDIEVELYARNGMHRAGVNAGACSSQLRVVASDKELRGEFADLSALSSVDTDDWQHLLLEARGKTLYFSVNGRQLLSLPYRVALDSLYGVDIRCKGFGRVSAVTLHDGLGGLLYQEDFGKEEHRP